MSNNFKKFKSTAQYQKYRNTDGWIYPAVNVVCNGIEIQTHYNNELRMRWSTTDANIVPSFSGDVSLADFKTWVDNASYPCEIKKDGTDFAYIKRSTGSTVADWTLRSDGSASHYNTPDKTDYLQMTEIENINVGLFENTVEHWQEVHFNFDKGCPEGFHKWFAHPYWNESRGKYTKLIGRYDSTPHTNISTADGIDVMYGGSQGNWTGNNYVSGIWNANLLLAATKATNPNLLEETYWEHVVLTYIFCAYYETFNTQSIYAGLQNGNQVFAGQWLNGQTDSQMRHDAGVVTANTLNTAYRFMHIENAIHGKQWIWGAGWSGNDGKYYMTYDDIKANASSILTESDADVVGTYPITLSNSYFGNADLWCIPTNTSGGSSSTRYCDAALSVSGSNRVAYLGGSSNTGAQSGGFARYFNSAVDVPYWDRRGRSTMNRGTENEISDERVTPILSIITNPITYGANASVKVVITDGVTGNLELYIDNQTQPYETLDVEDGYVFVVSNLSIGNHPIHVHYVGDEQYRPADAYSIITVNDGRVEPTFTLSIEPDTIGYEEQAEARITTEMDLEGSMDIYLDNETDPLNDEPVYATDGRTSIVLFDLSAGEHSIHAHFVGDEKYRPADAYGTITVRVTPEITVSATSPEAEFAVVTVRGPEDITGKFVLSFEDSNIEETFYLNNGQADLSIVGLSPGPNYFYLTYYGDDKYDFSTLEGQIEVQKYDTNLDIRFSSDNISAGESFNIQVTTPQYATGNIVFKSGDESLGQAPIKSAKATLELSNGMNAGTYTITAIFAGDDNYKPAEAYREITVNKVEAYFSVTADNIEYGKTALITIDTNEDSTGSMDIYIDNQTEPYNEEPVYATDGKAILYVSNLSIGNHPIHVHFNGDEKYLPADAYHAIIVSKITTSIELNCQDEWDVNDTNIIDVMIVADSKAYDATGNVEMYVDNESQPSYTNLLESGVTSFEHTFNTIGQHTIRVHYTGDGKYKSSDFNAEVTVTEE